MKLKGVKMECRHYRGTGYTYPLNKKDELSLCENCNRVLASKIMSQIVAEVFCK